MHSAEQSNPSATLWQGQNGRLELSGGIVSKYPKTAGGAAALAQEAQVLRCLRGLLPLDIPRPLDDSGLSYPCLPGAPLTLQVFKSLQPQRRGAVAAQAGAFLRAMHGLPPALLDGLVLPDADTARHWQDFYGKVSALLFPHFRTDAVEAVRWSFVRFLNRKSNFTVEPVVLHGDFGPTNLLYEEETGTVRVVDFGSVRLGDPAADIAALMGPRGYGEPFVKSLSPHYPATPRMLERARFYAQTFALEQALWGLEHGDKEAFEDGIHKYL